MLADILGGGVLGIGVERVGMLLVGMLLVGCGGEDRVQRFPLSGKITFEGQPVVDGWMTFRPVGKGPGAQGAIKDGVYTAREGWGTVGGPHRIKIVAFETGLERNSAAGASDGGLPKTLFSATIRRDIPTESSTLDLVLTKDDLKPNGG